MNGPGDIPLIHAPTSDTRPYDLISFIPKLGMASCRDRAEAFARSLSSKLKTLGSQPVEDDFTPHGNGSPAISWKAPHESVQIDPNIQPTHPESNSFFNFDCELESPASPAEECEYFRLIDTASNTPRKSASESVEVPTSGSIQSSADEPYYDVGNLNNGCAQLELKLNAGIVGTAAEISNGHNYLGSSAVAERIKSPHDETDPATKEIHMKEDDITKLASELEHELTRQETIDIQDQIISELLKRGEQIADSYVPQEQNNQIAAPSHLIDTLEVQSSAEEGSSVELIEIDKNNEEAIGINTDKVPNYGEEILHIELIEIFSTSPPKQQNAGTNLSEYPQSHPQKLITENTIETIEFLKGISDEQKSPTDIEDSVGAQRSAIDTDDEEDCRPQRVRRCSSLKTGKTPPGTPGRKKIVRFADVLGLDLADVKTFLDEVPTIPKSAFEDLEALESEPLFQLRPASSKLLMPLFQQPGGLPTFLDIVREKQVSLENAAISDPINQTITGTVRVRNLDFHKSVHIRYSLDGWRSYADLQANYVENSCDGFSDKFTFVLFGNSLHIGQRIEFAVRFQCKGQQFWDSNYGANYCFQCLSAKAHAINSVPSDALSHHLKHIRAPNSPSEGDAWCSSFY